MKVFIKILGLIGLINCIVLYGAEHKKGDSVNAKKSMDAQFSALETGDLGAENYVGAATGVSTSLYDPSSETRLERRSSHESLLMQQHKFAGAYADGAYQAPPKLQKQPPFEKLISRFQDKSTRAFARDLLNGITREERQQLNANAVVAPISPVQRSRRLSTADGQADNSDTQVNKRDKEAALVETLMQVMKNDLAQKERIHQAETALLQKQHKERSDQSDRLGQTASNNSRCAILTSGILGGASFALSIAAFVHTHKS